MPIVKQQPLSLRKAEKGDLLAAYATRTISENQKIEDQPPPDEKEIRNLYERYYRKTYEKSWEKHEGSFVLATIPVEAAKQQNITHAVADSCGMAVLGFYEAHPMTRSGCKDIYYISHFFSVRSPYETGKTMLQDCVRNAMDMNARAIMLDSVNMRSRFWFRDQGLFGTLNDKDTILFHMDKSNRLAVYAENFATLTAHLGYGPAMPARQPE